MKVVSEQNTSNLSTLGGRIEHSRKLKHLSQEELAKLVNIQRNKITYVEKDTPNRNLTLEELKRVADVLDVSTDYLLGRVLSNNTNDINISKETGLNNDSIEILKTISEDNHSNILNLFLTNTNLQDLTNLLEEYISIQYLMEFIFNTTFKEIEKNYKNNEDVIATEEQISNIKKFTIYINNIKDNCSKDFQMLNFMLQDNKDEFTTIWYIYDNLEKYNGKWNKNKLGEFNFKAIRTLNKTFKNFLDYIQFSIIEQNIKLNIEKLGKNAIHNKNIQNELKLLN